MIRAGLAPVAPAKLFDVDLGEPLRDVGDLKGYRAARALVWLHGTPLGWAQVPIAGDRCSAGAIGDAIREQLNWPVVRHLFADALQGDCRPPHLNAEELAEAVHPDAAGPWPPVTVAVCTRDRAASLEVCLRALEEVDYPDLDLLVVDNAPSDDRTRRLVEDCFPRFRYACEPRPGLDWARNRAILECRSELLAYTDDDVVVHPGWVRALAAAFAESPEIMAVTGLVLAYELETEAQALFERYGGFSRGFERRWYRATPGAAARQHAGSGKFGTGANMAYRRSLFDEIGGFDPALDVGTATNGGGDLEMFFRVLEHGHVLAYQPAAVVRHRHRRTYPELRTQIENNGIGFYSHLARTADAYPGERGAVLRLGVWWLWAWSTKRLILSFLRPSRMPRQLASSELLGSLRGPGRYRRSRLEAERVAQHFGALNGLRHGAVPGGKSRTAAAPDRPNKVAVRAMELAEPLRALTGIADYAAVRVYVSVAGWLVGYADIDNHGCDVPVERLAEALVDRLATRALGVRPTGEPNVSFQELVAAAFARLPAFASHSPEYAAGIASDVAVSVVVATLDRPDDLRRCLGTLLAQQSERPIEIVVVDNHPASGATAPVVDDFPGVRLVSEERRGLSYARNRGIAASSGAIVVTTDDDVTVPPDWLEHLVSPFGDPDVMGVTGNVLPLELDTQAQRLFERYGGLGRGFERRRYDGRWFEWFLDRAVPTWDLGATANAAFRSEVFSHPEIGLLDEALGAGTPTGCSEDTYLFYKVLKAGYSIVYEPRAYVWHRHRREMDGLKRQLHDYSAGHVAYHLTTLTRDGDLRALVRLAKHLPAWRVRQMLRAASGRSGYPVGLSLAEAKGNLAGPLALWRSRMRVRREGQSDPYVPAVARKAARP